MQSHRTLSRFFTRPLQVFATALTVSLSSTGWAIAGGVDWSFDILSYDARSALSADISIRFSGDAGTERPAIAQACPVIVLEVDYRPEPFWRRTWTRNLVTRQTHRDALRTLVSSHDGGRTVRIGMMGAQGLPQGSTTCSWSARGLSTFPDEGMQGPIYAFFHPV